MKIISHRGNLTGRNPEQENHPSYIQAAIDAGYDVEVDVWYVDGEYYLGHDSPQYRVYGTWLKELQEVLWCHAKNAAALEQMLSAGLHCFWHETDRYTLTSRGIPWCYPDNHMAGGITVVKDYPADYHLPVDALGVCTDYPEDWRKR
jgi:hypothetical protein